MPRPCVNHVGSHASNVTPTTGIVATLNPEISADAFKMPEKEEAPEGEAEGEDES